jgi:hypothetical protein
VIGSSLFWDVRQRRLVVTDVSGQPTMKFEDGTDSLSRNVSNHQLTLRNIPRRTNTSFTPRRKPEITQVIGLSLPPLPVLICCSPEFEEGEVETFEKDGTLAYYSKCS